MCGLVLRLVVVRQPDGRIEKVGVAKSLVHQVNVRPQGEARVRVP